MALGYFKDDVSRLARAIEYLMNPPANIFRIKREA